MIFYNSNTKGILDSIRLGDKFFIFDVDRTLFNTTSWHIACSTPGVLISKDNISVFRAIEQSTFGNFNVKLFSAFRKQTLYSFSE